MELVDVLGCSHGHDIARAGCHTGRDEREVFERFDAWLSRVSRGRPVMVSDNPAYDFQSINFGFDRTLGRNPVNDSMGNVEAFATLLEGIRTEPG